MSKHCSPHRKTGEGTCFLDKELRVIAKNYNLSFLLQNKKQPIDLSGNLYKQLSKELGSSWHKHGIVKSSQKHFKYILDKAAFKPCLHDSRYAWLSTSDINVIMEQYMEFDPSFKYLGTYPSNILELVDVSDLLKQSRNSKKVSMILNFDSHTESGSHWVAIYIDKISKQIEYFDSIGSYPTKSMLKVLKFLFKTLNFKAYDISRPFQREDGECGIYAIYYVLQRILGYTCKEITDLMVTDSGINKYRDILYRECGA